LAEEFLPKLAKKLKESRVTIKGDEGVCALIDEAESADLEDWANEFLDLTLAVKLVDNIDEAIEHIAQYSTRHSECIVTDNYEASQRFLNEVDAAAVYVNASTRFTDGGEFGFGAEIGISTQKLHARGPLGLSDLTSQKYQIFGQGQIR
jgi:glutamate-5-semialdehyde dehydrogenase